MWNIIQLDDGQWYEVDVTFDEGLSHGDNIRRDFFCLTTDEMSNTTTTYGTRTYHKRTVLDKTTREFMSVVPIANGTTY